MGQDDQDRKSQDPVEVAFDALQARDIRNERRIFWWELVTIAVTALLTTAYFVALLLRHGAPPTPPL